jgi:homoserine O-acetyltransferase/O-succinyltransferase
MSASAYYTEEIHGPHQYFELGDFPLNSGYTLRGARLGYKTHGTLSAARDNAILFPHFYSGTSATLEHWIGEGRALDPTNYFIIMPGQFGGGFSSSPSNTLLPFNQGAFPPVSIGDDVRAQHRLITEHFGITALQLVVGFSMGGMQTYEWAVRYPEMVKRAAPMAANARTPVHNTLLIDVHEALLKSDPAWNDGFYTDPHAVHLGLRRHALAFALEGMCRAFYREEAWREAGFASLDDFKRGFLEAYFLPMDPNNLLCQARKWREADVSRHTNGDLAAALGRITASTIVTAVATDMFFPVEDCQQDATMIQGAEVRIIDSVWGHLAAFCVLEKDAQAIDAILRDALALPAR